jgi:hypothetical protein
MAGSVVAVLGLTGCSGPVYQATGLDNPLDQSAYLWPDTAVDQVATGARTATPPVIFTVRASDWFNSPEETTALIARTCGPGYRTARIFRHDGAGSPLHPVELEVHCGDLKSRVAVYPEPGTAGLSAGLSENLSEMTTPPTAAETGDLVVLR